MKNLRIFGVIASLLCLFLATQAYAATQTQRPVSDFAGSGTWIVFPAAPVTYYDKVNEAVADDDSSYIYCTAAGRRLFGFTAFSVPAGATVNRLNIIYRHKKTSPAACNIRSALRVGGAVYQATDSGVNPTNGVWNTRTYNYNTNPRTGAAWLVDDINGVGANPLQAFGVRVSDASPNPYCTQVYAEVDYTVPNSPPVGGYTADNVIPAAQCTQSTDGNGIITISFRVKDANLDPCTLKTLQYSVDGGGAWNPPNNGDASGSLSAGWTNNGGSNYTSAADFSGPVYSFTFNTKHADVAGINGTDQDDIRIRFTVNDGAADSTSPAASENFTVDDLDPATLVNTDLSMRPSAGDANVTLAGSFTERHPNTNTFSLAINGGAYGAGSAGDTNTATPSAHSTPAGAALDGDDYVSKVRCVHVDDYGNSGTNENLAPSTNGVKPYTPPAPTVDNAKTNTVDVTVNKNASEVDTVTYAIYESTTGQYVQAGGNLGAGEVWQTRAAWGTKTVTGLTPPVSNYIFQTKSKNPNGDNPESDLSGGASVGNSAPLLHDGTTESLLPFPVQLTDGSGDVTITFKIKDLDLNPCSVKSGSFYYQVNGTGWVGINDGYITGTKAGLASAADLSGPTHTLVWDTSKIYIDNAVSQNVQLRFIVNDGTSDSVYGVSPAGFNVDNLDPAALVTTNVYIQPLASQATVTLNSSFTETNPKTNSFYLALNGGDYGSATAGQSNTATPTPQATAAGATLDGNDYLNKVKCVHVDDFGNSGSTGNNENLSPDSAKKYVKPYTPADPTVGSGTASTVDVRVNKYPSEVPGLEYAIYVSSHAKYVQADGTLGDSPVWRTVLDWGTRTVSGLTSPVSDYYFKTKSRNPSDAAHLASSDSELSDPVNTTGTPPTAEAIVSYSPAANAENVSPEAKVIVTFDRDMNASSVENVFSMKAIYNNTGGVIDQAVYGSFAWAANRTLTFTPSPAMSRAYTYRVRLSGGVKDYDGNDLTLDLSWNFRVVLDRQVQNVFISRDGKVMVVLSVNAIPNDGSVDIDRNPVDSPKVVDKNKIIDANNKVLARGDEFFRPINFSISELNAYNVDDVRITDPFANTVTLTLYYDDENGDGYVDGESPPVLARGLVIYRLDEDNGLWVRVPTSSVNSGSNYVSATIPRFGVYSLMATPAYDLSEAFAFPNPYKPSAGHTSITFTNLSATCTIKIFTLTGDLVKTINVNDGTGQAVWSNVRNEAGEGVASGLYLYVIQNEQNVKRGKLVIIK